MEQGSVKLPVKTRIAVMWIVISGLLGTVILLVYTEEGMQQGPIPEAAGIFVLAVLGLGVCYLLAAAFLSMKRVWSWAVAVLLLSVWFVFWLVLYVHSYYDPASTISHVPLALAFGWYFIPLVLAVVDVKNYLLVVRNRAKGVRAVTDEPGGDDV